MTSVLSNNSTTAPLNGSAVFFGAWVSTTAFQAIKVSVLVDQIGTLIVQHATTASPSNIVYEDTIPVNDETETFLEVIVKSAFFRVKFENGTTTQTSFKLQTTSGLQYGGASGGGGVASEVEVTNTLLDVYDASSVALLQELLDTGITIGAIDISGVSPIDGRLPTFDASGVEQLTTIAGYLDAGISVSNFPATQDVSGSVSVSNFPTTQDISGSVSVSNQITGFATESTLEEVATTAEDISLQLLVPQRSWVEVDFDTQSSLIVSGAGTWRVPLTGEQGWEYVNTTIGGATGYFYSNTALVAGGLESDITLGSLTTMWFIGNYRLATEVNPNRRFYLSVYTKPQGAGDFQPWYRSSKTWQLPNSAIVSKGADVFYYAGLDISTIYKEYDHTAYELAVSRGLCASDEVIQFMSFAVDSATPANEFDAVIKHAGFSTAGGTNRVVSYTRASREKIAEDNLKAITVQSGELLVKDASAVALLAEIADGITVQVGEVDISGATFTESKLNVFDNSAYDELTTIREILGDTLLTVNYGLLNDTPTYAPIRCDASGALLVSVNDPQTVVEISGGVVADLSGGSFTDAKLNVFDLSANEHLFAIEDILETGFINVYDASSELVLEAIKTQTDKLTFVDTDTSNNLKVIDLANNAILSNLSFFTNEDTGTDLRVKQMGSVDVRNPEGENLAISGNVGIIADQTVGITGSVQTHNFASSNGTDWHHLHSDANGNIITLSRTHDDGGNGITSTLNGGVRALDVSVSGVPVVEISGNPVVEISGNVAVSASATQYGSYGNLANNVASILPAGVTSGIDVSAWSYFVGAYQDYYNSTPTTGFLRLQYSFDNTTYYDLFNTTVSPSGAGTPRTANFQKQDIPAINWIRFKNDTNGTMTSVTITLLGGSLS